MSRPLKRGRACMNCRFLKIKCDGTKPICGPCRKRPKDDECEYSEGPTRSRTKALEETVRRLEARLHELEHPEDATPSVTRYDPLAPWFPPQRTISPSYPSRSLPITPYHQQPTVPALLGSALSSSPGSQEYAPSFPFSSPSARGYKDCFRLALFNKGLADVAARAVADRPLPLRRQGAEARNESGERTYHMHATILKTSGRPGRRAWCKHAMEVHRLPAARTDCVDVVGPAAPAGYITRIQPLLHRVLSIAALELGLEPPGDAVFRHSFRDREIACIKTCVVPARQCPPYPVPRLFLSAPRHPAPVGLKRHGRCRAPNGRAAGKHLDVAASTAAAALGRILENVFPYRSQPTDAHLLRKFSHLTHLEIRDWRDHDETLKGWEGIALIPRLTHLCFHELESMISIIMLCLQHCKSLEVLVVACGTPLHIGLMQERLASSRDTVTHDPRSLVLRSQGPVTADPQFLVLLVPNYYQEAGWEAFARGGEDFWAVADRHVRKRRSGATDDYVVCSAVDLAALGN
ncbi:hypothetical protein B0H13DRAFT_1924806 [Mycena leptocephala]|nr:hypothetical protein B0H13DRAFT_1924806 [Mycena leptocephala]